MLHRDLKSHHCLYDSARLKRPASLCCIAVPTIEPSFPAPSRAPQLLTTHRAIYQGCCCSRQQPSKLTEPGWACLSVPSPESPAIMARPCGDYAEHARDGLLRRHYAIDIKVGGLRHVPWIGQYCSTRDRRPYVATSPGCMAMMEIGLDFRFNSAAMCFKFSAKVLDRRFMKHTLSAWLRPALEAE